MTSTLLLLTNSFPYGRGEEFIEPELAITARRFDKVHVIATQVTQVGEQTRTLPPNAQATSVRIPEQTPLGRARLLLRGLPPVLKSRESRQRAAEGWPRVKPWVSSLFFEARAQAIAKSVAPFLRTLSFEPKDRVVIYSFWFHVTGRVGEIVRSTLKERFPETDIRFVSRAHRYDLYHDESAWGYLPQRRNLLERLDALYPISRMGADYLSRLYPESAHKISVQYLGSDDPSPSPASSRERCFITSCSYLIPVKRVNRIPRILELLGTEGVPVTWTHLGDGPELQDLRLQTKALKSDIEVNLVGHVPHEKLFTFYAENPSTLFLNLSRSEGIPVSIMEAISGGIPVVATDVGGVAEIVRPGQSGWLIDSQFSDQQAADAILRIWRLSDSDYEAVRATTRALWETTFRANTNYAAFSRLLLP